MDEKCDRCGPSATNFFENTVTGPFASLDAIMHIPSSIQVMGQPGRNNSTVQIYNPRRHTPGDQLSIQHLKNTQQQGAKALKILTEIAEEKPETGDRDKVAQKHIQQINPNFRKWVSDEGKMSLRTILPDDHQLFQKINANQELEQKRLEINRMGFAAEIQELWELANSQKKYSNETKNWLMHKSPFTTPNSLTEKFETPLVSLMGGIYTKNIIRHLDYPIERKEVICNNCGTIVRTYMDFEKTIKEIENIFELVQTMYDCLTRYDSAMINWERDDKAKKDKAKKIRMENKMQANIEALEAERKAMEEKLRKLKGE